MLLYLIQENLPLSSITVFFIFHCLFLPIFWETTGLQFKLWIGYQVSTLLAGIRWNLILGWQTFQDAVVLKFPFHLTVSVPTHRLPEMARSSSSWVSAVTELCPWREQRPWKPPASKQTDNFMGNCAPSQRDLEGPSTATAARQEQATLLRFWNQLQTSVKLVSSPNPVQGKSRLLISN